MNSMGLINGLEEKKLKNLKHVYVPTVNTCEAIQGVRCVLGTPPGGTSSSIRNLVEQFSLSIPSLKLPYPNSFITPDQVVLFRSFFNCTSRGRRTLAVFEPGIAAGTFCCQQWLNWPWRYLAVADIDRCR